MTDKIDEAVKAVEDTIQMLSIPVTIASTGRPFQIAVPADMTDAELIEVTAWMLTALAATVKVNREKGKSRIVIPHGVRVVQ